MDLCGIGECRRDEPTRYERWLLLLMRDYPAEAAITFVEGTAAVPGKGRSYARCAWPGKKVLAIHGI